MSSQRRHVRHVPSFWIGTALLALVTLTAFFAPLLVGDAALVQNPAEARQGSSAAHPLGTDELGRDLLLRTLAATGPSMIRALAAVIAGAAIGIALGALAPLLPPRISRGFGTVIDIAVGFPGVLAALLIAAILAPSASTAVIAMAVAFVPVFARLTMTLASAIAGMDYIAAARLLGVRPVRTVVRHIVPNAAEPLLVTATTAVGISFIGLAGLSFLGLGAQPPDYDWGQILNGAFVRIYTDPEATIGPALMIVVTGLAFTLTAEGWMARTVARRAEPVAEVEGADGVGPAATRDGREAVLRVRDLDVGYPTGRSGSRSRVVRSLSFDVAPGEIVGIVGESGSGKSQTVLAAIGLLERPAVVDARTLEFDGVGLTELSPRDRDAVLRGRVALIGQNPLSSLNPVLRVGGQVSESASSARRSNGRERRALAVSALARVGITRPEQRVGQYPYELSGGMRQRAMIASAALTRPRLLIADEPTTALDVTVQQLVLDELRELRDSERTAILFISHDISVIASLCDRVLVMLAGELVDACDVSELHSDERHPYTAALVDCVPDMATDRTVPLATVPHHISRRATRKATS